MRCYLAGPLEFADLSHGESWKTLIKKALPNILFYDPAERESNKTGTQIKESHKRLIEYKQTGNWSNLCDMMRNIWWDTIKCEKDRAGYLRDLNYIKDTVSDEDYLGYGDFQAVALSDFIIARLPKDVKIFGTAAEITLAYLLGIPVLILLPDSDIDYQNSTLCFFVKDCGGDFFKTITSLTKFIKDVYCK
jgi:hypothetical protein